MRGFLFLPPSMLQWLQDNAPDCFFKSMFGIDCPGCGMTRAFFALIRGNLMESLSYNPGLIPFLITVTALLIQLKLKHPRGGFIIMWMFIITTIITVINFSVKQYMGISLPA